MPIFSRRFSLWTRLYGRMLLEPTSDARVTPMVSEIVVPVLSADKVLETPTVSAEVTADISGGTGTYIPFFTVPSGEEWSLVLVNTPTTAGNSKVQVRVNGNLINKTPASTSEQIVDMSGFVLREADSLGMRGTGNGSDTSRSMTQAYMLVSLEI